MEWIAAGGSDVKKGLLIYNRVDYDKNKAFADAIPQEGANYNLDIELVLSDEIALELDGSKLYWYKEKRRRPVDFVINRTRLSEIGEHFEAMGARVFNPAEFSRITNDKFKTHRLLAMKGIPSLHTRRYLGDNVGLAAGESLDVIKTVDGHGGNEVFLRSELAAVDEDNASRDGRKSAESLFARQIIFQKLAPQTGRDVRVFVLGDQILGAVERISESDFRANYSRGGKAKAFEVSDDLRAKVGQVTDIIKGDFFGVDFLMTDQGLLFNEIEDVVGSRTLYATQDVDVIGKFVSYVADQLAMIEK